MRGDMGRYRYGPKSDAGGYGEKDPQNQKEAPKPGKGPQIGKSPGNTTKSCPKLTVRFPRFRAVRGVGVLWGAVRAGEGERRSTYKDIKINSNMGIQV